MSKREKWSSELDEDSYDEDFTEEDLCQDVQEVIDYFEDLSGEKLSSLSSNTISRLSQLVQTLVETLTMMRGQFLVPSQLAQQSPEESVANSTLSKQI